MKSIPKHKKDSKNKSISKPKNNLQTIEIETSSKFKNELFQKLFDNYNASKERVNTYGNNRHPKYIRPSPKSTKITQKIVFKNRNPSYIENLKKSRKRLQSSNPKIENNTYTNINPNSTYVIKSKKPSRSNNAKKKLKDYPNLIKGVLRQVNYYNLNNNINYNDNIRYKPIDDFYNEQSSIFIKNIIENNTPNTSINLDEQKSELQSNNNNIFNPKNNNDNYSNNIHKIKNNEEDEYLEQEIKSNKVKYRRSRGENNIKSIKNISPISPIKIRNIYRNDIPYLNEDIYNDNSDNNIKNNYNRKPSFINNNETIVTDDDDNFRNKKKDKLVITSSNFCLKNENTPKINMESENKNKIDLLIENVNDFTLLNTKKSPIINLKLEEKPADSFNIIQNRKNNVKNQNNFNNLEATSLPMINYMGVYKNSDNVNKEPIYNNNGGKLSFNNDDEVIRYIKKKIREEKDLQYNNNKMKYNYFNLIKMFHGKKLYEIGLENNLDKINAILEKENVEIEHEPIMFIFKKDLSKIKSGEIILKNNSTNNSDNHEEIEKLIKEKEKIINENEKLKKKIELMRNNNSKNNFDDKNKDYDKLLKEIEQLNEQNKEKQNMLNEYEKKMSQYDQVVEVNNILQVEKEKYTKYIIELQEYNEKIIIEYNKMKAQLENELSNKKNNNNNFNSNELDIISADFFELINTNRTKSINNINNITFEEIQNEEINDPNNFGDEGYDKNKITIRQSFDSNQKETLHTIKDNNDINADLQNMDENSNKKSIKDYLNMNKYTEDKNINNEEEIIVDDDININNINNKFNDGKINNDEEIIDDNLNINANLEKANIEDEKNNEIYDRYNNNKKKHVNFSDKDSNSIKDESREISPKKKDESMFRALQRIKNKRKIDEKNNKEKNATRKSEKISGLAKMLEKKLNENPSHNPLNNGIRNDENNVDNDEDPDDNEMY